MTPTPVTQANTLFDRIAALNKQSSKPDEFTLSALKREAEGLLLEASLIRNTFGMTGPGGTIKGKVPRELGPKVATCFNRKVRIIYEERRVLDETTEQEKKAVRLIDITPTDV